MGFAEFVGVKNLYAPDMVEKTARDEPPACLGAAYLKKKPRYGRARD
jgi:hypothetical protein